MLHANFQKQYGRNSIVEMFRNVVENNGNPVEIRYLSSRDVVEGDSFRALFFFHIDFPQAKEVLSHVLVEYAAFKGHLVGFSIPTDEVP